MRAKEMVARAAALLLALCLLPLAGLAGAADSSALAYDMGLQLLLTASLTDKGKLEEIRLNFEQAGSYLLGEQYRSYVEGVRVRISDRKLSSTHPGNCPLSGLTGSLCRHAGSA